jgi:adenylate cyclase
MPFRDLSPARDEDYFCEGMAEEILGALARLPGLRVAASAAASRLGGVETARALNVGAFLEGSVRRAGDRARIAIRLINTGDGFTLWAESFDRDLADIFLVQDEIARAIVAALGVQLLAKDEARLGIGGTADPKALDLYLHARQLVRKELETEARTAAELFRDAVRQDPRFALAFAGLADVLAQIARLRVSGWNQAEEDAIAAAEQAVAIEPGLAEAHLALGAALHLRGDPRAAAAFEHALELSPADPMVHYRFARYRVLEGDKPGAIVHYERAFALAPDDYRTIVFALQEYQAVGDEAGEQSCLRRSAEAIERHLELNPDDVRAYSHGAGVQALLGNETEAERYIAKALALRPDDYSNLATLACAAMLNCDVDRALDLLEQAVGTGRGDRAWTLADNDLKPLHGHPRFKALIERMV